MQNFAEIESGRVIFLTSEMSLSLFANTEKLRTSDARKQEVLRTKFLKLQNGSCGLKTPCEPEGQRYTSKIQGQ